ncbi:DNA repair protein RecN [Curvibacter sp. APW13]|uniref:DNA repair protein RecN n=1 Tax=Curvibacter sp. APW13 TaxID=3077236 RepID=UPI0028DE3794|nr:DNA repair protein RecN [Curvibacter sp. APW13]MDT8992457.1 DNA repair protein RecN [Curvibacter sp. APW13]
MALRRIALRDFIIVRSLDLDLESGFTVLTGETGAGKSILIDALQLATGARAESTVVREGCARAEVSAEFDHAPALEAFLAEGGFEVGETLLLRRTVDAQGRSRAWINGSPATAQQLRTVGEQLLDIHGQHAWQSLTRPDAVRALLDAYARVSTATLSQTWSDWRAALATLDNARNAQDSLQRERERLQWQLGELQKLAPRADEWAEINAEHQRLSNSQNLLQSAQDVREALQEGEQATIRQLNRCIALLQDSAALEPQFREPLDLLHSSLAQVEEVALSLRAYGRHTEPDPQRLAELDERLGLWISLARRYKRSPEELPTTLNQWQQELATLDAAADLAALEKAEASAQARYLAEAHAVGKARAKAAPQLARAITQAMQGLGMQGGQFEVALRSNAQPAQHGLEDVEFLVAGHAGSTPRPVGKVASGGELSRIALAIAVTTSQLGNAQTLIFDEVDSGVGGAVAETVGRLMRQLGADRQVLAVTHLPQVAGCAHHHLQVAKSLDGGQTVSSVAPLEKDRRIQEIARMLGGERITDTSLAHAREMLEGAGA